MLQKLNNSLRVGDTLNGYGNVPQDRHILGSSDDMKNPGDAQRHTVAPGQKLSVEHAKSLINSNSEINSIVK